ncbi:MAG: glycosyltransferase family 2 protein [Clostridia bacterium]|nr:glycosyltransferase family 2 protein [Clostridia bacterium]
MDEKMLVSIIVPVYNVENYLRQCVDSLRAQTYQKIEIILVDDGSTDSSGTICEEYAAIDERVIVLHQKNAGQGAAREAGVAASCGGYVMTVDGDDWLDVGTVEKCVQKMQEDERIECVMLSYSREYLSSSIHAHIFDGDKTIF